VPGDEPDRPGLAASLWRCSGRAAAAAAGLSREQITPVEGLRALPLDALTSVAYGPEAIIAVLAVAGAGALVVDYTLTVAVSIAAGVASLTSAFPSLTSATVPICLGILALITLLNLRGLADAARGFHPLALHAAQPGRSLLPTRELEAVSVLLVLKAFSAGCSALTGVEAIANGVPLFKQPRQRRAKQTEMLLGGILGAMLLGLAVLADRWHIGPRSGQTVPSQIIADAIGRQWAYYLMSLTITVVLALAANTSSGALLIAVGGNTLTLIPLYAIGVFTGFTLSQAGLVIHWRRTRPPRWQQRAIVNGTGAVVTAVATMIFLISKFTEGAWVVVLAVPTFIFGFTRIHSYYRLAGKALGLSGVPGKPAAKATIVVVPVVRVSRLVQHALS
jgi:hypothetical protein